MECEFRNNLSYIVALSKMMPKTEYCKLQKKSGNKNGYGPGVYGD